MLAAIAAVHAQKGFFNTDGGYEFPLLLALTAAGIAFSGPGAYSLDALFDWSLSGPDWGWAATVGGGLVAGAVLLARSLRQRGGVRLAGSAPSRA